MYIIYQIIGTVSLSELTRGFDGGWWLHGLAVSRKYRHKGVGTALVTRATREAAGRHAAVVEAVTSELQIEARAIFQKAGYVVPN